MLIQITVVFWSTVKHSTCSTFQHFNIPTSSKAQHFNISTSWRVQHFNIHAFRPTSHWPRPPPIPELLKCCDVANCVDMALEVAGYRIIISTFEWAVEMLSCWNGELSLMWECWKCWAGALRWPCWLAHQLLLSLRPRQNSRRRPPSARKSRRPSSGPFSPIGCTFSH